MINIAGFLTKNNHKNITVKVWIYTAVYRFFIRFIPMKYVQKYIGKEGEESPDEITPEAYQYAKLVARVVNRSANKTPWEAKCLVRALTAQKLLKKKEISSTLYLGVGKEKEKMIAHAWLRTGNLYVTGGNGKEYATVAKYRV